MTQTSNHSEEIFRLAFESCPSGMVMVDDKGLILLVNAETERMFGYTRDELVSQSIENLVPPRFRGHHPGYRRQYMAEPKVRSMGAGRDLFGLRKDGSEFPVEIGLNPIQTSNGLCVLGVIVDITERKQAEERFRLAVEACPGGIVMVDSAGAIQLVNAETERMFGYQRQELIGQPVEILIPMRMRGEHPGYRAKYNDNPGARRMGAGRDLYGRRKDGSEFPVEVGLNPIHTRDGLFILSVIIDISERKLAEQSLEQQRQELQRSNAELEQFAYVASHDLQEPLRMVANYTELLAERYKGRLDDKADKYINYAVDGAKRMQQLVADLLALSRVGTQAKPLRPTDANIVVRHVQDSMASAIRKTGAEVLCGKLPTVNADEVQLGQVFQNLIGNAIKFRSDRPPRIAISAESMRGQWQFVVEDNGIGIEKEYSERVFQMFQRLHERDKYDGSGIGLAIVKKIVERHGGRVWFESTPGEGTKFFFTMPAVKGGAAS